MFLHCIVSFQIVKLSKNTKFGSHKTILYYITIHNYCQSNLKKFHVTIHRAGYIGWYVVSVHKKMNYLWNSRRYICLTGYCLQQLLPFRYNACSLIAFYYFFFQPSNNLFFQPWYIWLGYSQHVCNFFLSFFVTCAESKS